MATSKRKSQDQQGEQEEEQEEELGQEKEEWEELRKKRRRVEFREVTIFNFKRRQGFVCVPSQARLIRSQIN